MVNDRKLKIQNHITLFSKINILKFFNLLKIVLSYIYSRAIRRAYHCGNPYSISVEPTNYCNLQCPECPSGQRKFTRPSGNMSFDLYKKTIDELHRHLISIFIYFQGEPYLNKQLFDFIKYAKTKNIYTIASTNAHFLDEENSSFTIESGLDRLIISMDGTSQEAYSSYRTGGDIIKVKTGIENIVRLKKQLKSKKPFISLQFLVFKTNEHQIDEMKNFAKHSMVDELQLKTAQIYDYKNGNSLIPSNNKYSRYAIRDDGTYTIKNKLHNHCFRMWSSCVITWDGIVVPCCFDKDAKYIFGNINKQSFTSIWDSEKYNDFRNKILKQRKSINICLNCTE